LFEPLPRISMRLVTGNMASADTDPNSNALAIAGVTCEVAPESVAEEAEMTIAIFGG
jgi:hypothetical protein